MADFFHYGEPGVNETFLLNPGPIANISSLKSFLSEFSIDVEDSDYSEMLKELVAAAAEDSDGLPAVDPIHDSARKIVGFIELYLVPAVALVGMLGNLASFIVFVGTYLRTQSSSVYLAALSVADFGFLLSVLVSKLGMVGFDLYQHNGWCQFFSYVTYVTSFLSMWYVVAFTVERYIATHYPFKRRTCTCRRATIVVIGLCVLALILYSFGLFTSGVTVILGYPTCGPTPKYYKFVSIVHHVDTVITLIAPFLIILVLNLKIGYKVARFYRKRTSTAACDYENIINEERDSSPRGRTLRISISAIAQQEFSQRQLRVTRMLLAVSTTFLALNLPRHATRTYTFIKALTDSMYMPTGNFLLVQKIFHLLYYLHFSVNIFLYSGTEESFRRAMCWQLRKMRTGVHEYCAKLSACKSESHRRVTVATNTSPEVSVGGESRFSDRVTPL